MAGVRSKPLRSGKYQAWFINRYGGQEFFTGTRNKTQTRHMAQSREEEERQIRMGFKPLPKAHDQHARRSLARMIDEHLAWGKSQGGIGGKGWSKDHRRKRQSLLDRWLNRLGFQELGQLVGCLPQVEAALRNRQSKGLAGKTLANDAEALHAFCRWCVERGYLAVDPLAKLRPFDTTPTMIRRALTVEEIHRLLNVCPLYQRLLL